MPIYLSDYRKKFSRSARYNPEKYKEAEARRELLDDLVEFELLYKEARAKKIEETEQIKRMMVRALLRQEVNVTPKVTNEELKAYYDAHPEEFQEIRASHILLKNRPQKDDAATGKPEEYQQAQRAKAEKILAELKAGKDFAQLAQEHSEDTTAKNGGDLSFFTAKKMVEPFAEAAFALKEIGDLSDLVETRFGFHIIKLTDRRIQEFDKVKGVIKNNLMKTKRNEAHDAYLTKLKAQASITVNEQRYEELVKNLGSGGPEAGKQLQTMGQGHPMEEGVHDQSMQPEGDDLPTGKREPIEGTPANQGE